MCCLVMVSMSMGLMGCIQVHTVLLMQWFHVLYVIGLVWWRSMSASMSVLVLPVRHCHVGTNWLHLVVLSVVHRTWMLGTLQRKLHTRHVCQVCGHRWMKQPPVIGNPLAALGCWLVGATVHVGRVPVTAGAPAGGTCTRGVYVCMLWDCTCCW